MNGLRSCLVFLAFSAALRAGEGGVEAQPGPAAPPSPFERLQQRADQLGKEAVELYKKGELLDARARLQFLCLLRPCPVGMRLRMGETGRMLQGVDNIVVALQKQWIKELPALERRLDLVIRNRPLPEAVGEIARASGLRIELLAGSAEDAAQLAGMRERRIVWLDLRNATVAQALEWLTGITRLDWRAGKDGVTVGSQRLLPGESAWVYEVSRLVHPSEQIAALPDAAGRSKAIGEAVTAFRDAVRKALALKEEDIHWHAPGQLLIWGPRTAHDAAGKLFAALADPNAQVAGDLTELHRLTPTRFTSNQEGAGKYLDQRAQERIAEAFRVFSWRLLSAAAAGKVDLEALTELQAAWAEPQAEAFVNGVGACLALRSAFAVHEAARALPKDEELPLLARAVTPLVGKQVTAALEDFEARPGDQLACLRALYAALLVDRPDVRARALAAFTPSEKRVFPNALWPDLAASLLGKEPQAARISSVLQQRPAIAGEDWVVLAALAARRSGNEAWDAWRGNARELIGSQWLPGSVVVLVNQLGRSALPIVK